MSARSALGNDSNDEHIQECSNKPQMRFVAEELDPGPLPHPSVCADTYADCGSRPVMANNGAEPPGLRLGPYEQSGISCGQVSAVGQPELRAPVGGTSSPTAAHRPCSPSGGAVTAEVTIGAQDPLKPRRATVPPGGAAASSDIVLGNSHHHHHSSHRGHHSSHHRDSHTAHGHSPTHSHSSSQGTPPRHRASTGAPDLGPEARAGRRATTTHHSPSSSGSPQQGSPVSNQRSHHTGGGSHPAVTGRAPSFTSKPLGATGAPAGALRPPLSAYCKAPSKRSAETAKPSEIAKGFAAGWMWNRQLLVLQAGTAVPGLAQQVSLLPKHPALALWLVQPAGTRCWLPVYLGACSSLQLWMGSLVHDNGSFGWPEQLSSYRLLMDMQRRGFSLTVRYRPLKHDNDYHDKLASFDFPLNVEDGGVRPPQLPGGASLTDFPVVNMAAHQLYLQHFGALLPAAQDAARSLNCVQEQ